TSAMVMKCMDAALVLGAEFTGCRPGPAVYVPNSYAIDPTRVGFIDYTQGATPIPLPKGVSVREYQPTHGFYGVVIDPELLPQVTEVTTVAVPTTSLNKDAVHTLLVRDLPGVSLYSNERYDARSDTLSGDLRRAILIGDEISAKVGGYVLGNMLISVIAGVLTLVWLLVFNVPYAVLLAITVAVLDLIPVVGSIIGGVLVSLVALTVSVPVCLATAGFVVLYRFAEDYLLVPKIIGSAVKVPALVTVVAVLLGGALLGVVGALVAIPIAAAALLLAEQVLYPRLDRA
ncbi:AI-2E family transporter, partial [Kibdelosporangium lantanae]